MVRVPIENLLPSESNVDKHIISSMYFRLQLWSKEHKTHSSLSQAGQSPYQSTVFSIDRDFAS